MRTCRLSKFDHCGINHSIRFNARSLRERSKCECIIEACIEVHTKLHIRIEVDICIYPCMHMIYAYIHDMYT